MSGCKRSFRHWIGAGMALGLLLAAMALPAQWDTPEQEIVTPREPQQPEVLGPALDQLLISTEVERADGEQGAVAVGDEVIYRTTVSNHGDVPVPSGRLMLRVPIPTAVRLLVGDEGPPAADVAYSSDGGRSWRPHPETDASVTDLRYVYNEPLPAGESVTFWLRAQVR